MKSAGSHFRYILSCMLALYAFWIPDLVADESPQWQLEQLSTYEGNRKRDLGILLFTTDAESKGAAFKCEGRSISGYLTDRPTDILKTQTTYQWRGIRRPVQYSVNQGDEKTGEWFRSKDLASYMLDRDANMALLKSALAGSEIMFSLDGEQFIEVVLPPIDAATFDQFRESCR